MTRITSRMMLGLVLGFAAGCGGSSSPDQAKAPAAEPLKPSPVTAIPPIAQTPPAEKPPEPAAPVAPAAPTLSGELAGQPFAPAVEFQGDTLYLRTTKPDGSPDRSVELKLTAEQVKRLDGLKLTIAANDPSGPEVPLVMTVVPGRQPSELKSFAGAYDLTLELGPKADGRLPGKLILTLPAADKTHLAGTFTAALSRSPAEPPGPDDAPFVQGQIKVAGWKDDVKVGYVRVGGGDPPVLDMMFIGFGTAGSWAPSKLYKPRESLVVAGDKEKPGRYEHTHLPPGRYLLFVQAYAKPDGGPVVWKWVDVKPGSQETADFTIDAGRYGGLEVAVPAGTTGPVMVVPADDKPWDEATAVTAAAMLDLQAEPKDNKAAFARVAPGKYEVRTAGLTPATVEVKPGAAAKVELKK